jgi:hypothetical protein
MGLLLRRRRWCGCAVAFPVGLRLRRSGGAGEKMVRLMFFVFLCFLLTLRLLVSRSKMMPKRGQEFLIRKKS